MDARHARQSGLVDSGIFDVPVTVIGAGGIGSFTTLALAKIGFKNIKVFDDDSIEVHNLGNQFYRIKDLSKLKVAALAEIVQDFEDVVIEAKAYKYSMQNSKEMEGLVISAVDSMQARKLVYDSIKNNKAVHGFIDGRMGGNQLEVYTVNMTNKADKVAYEKTLWSDDQTADIPCTQKAVMYNVLTIASWIVNQARLLLSKKGFNRELILDLENMLLVQSGEVR